MKSLHALALLAPLAVQAQAPDLAVPFQRKQLPNGLTVVLVRRPGVPAVSLRLAARVGSSEDPIGRSGLAAVTARALAPALAPAGGLPGGGQEALDQAWDAVLAERRFQEAENARAAYSLSTPASDPSREAALRKAFADALARTPEPPAPGPASSLEVGPGRVVWGRELPWNEAAAWCRELAGNLRSLELPAFYRHREAVAGAGPAPALDRMAGLVREQAYPGSLAARPAQGWTGEAARLRREEARDFAARAFAPGNLALVVVGDLAWSDLDPLLASTFGALEPRDPLPPAVSGEPLGPVERRVIQDMDDQPAYMAAWRVPGTGHRDYPALQVAADLLGGGRTGRLLTRIVEGLSIARSAGASIGDSGRGDGNLFTVWAEARGDRAPGDLAQALMGDVDRLRSQPPSPEQVERVVARARAARALELDNPARLATALARAWALTGDEASHALALQRLAAVRPEDVVRAVKAHLSERPGVQAIGLRPRRAALGDDTLEGDLAELLTSLVQRQYPKDPMRVGEEVRSQLDQILSLPIEQKRKIRDELRRRVAESAPTQETPK